MSEVKIKSTKILVPPNGNFIYYPSSSGIYIDSVNSKVFIDSSTFDDTESPKT